MFQFKKVCPRSSEEQDAHDVELAKEMEKAHGAAGDIVSLGKTMNSCRQEFVREILPQVQSALSDTIHRVQHSYGLTMFATLKVRIFLLGDSVYNFYAHTTSALVVFFMHVCVLSAAAYC